MEIGKFTENESTNDSDNQPRRAEASHKDRLDEAAIAQRNRAAVAVWLRYIPLFPAVERAKRKSAAWLTVFPERRLA